MHFHHAICSEMSELNFGVEKKKKVESSVTVAQVANKEPWHIKPQTGCNKRKSLLLGQGRPECRTIIPSSSSSSSSFFLFMPSNLKKIMCRFHPFSLISLKETDRRFEV
ncbi:hypothetical protein TWF132_009059 [Orbilia oligospora]|nr:hypothetical protein TWF132_009059 [Orbilia oligospora]